MSHKDMVTIDLYEFWLVIWKAKIKIILMTLVFAVASVMFALSLPNKYTSEVVVISQNAEGEGGLAAMAGQLGGIASIAGLNLGGASDDTLVNIERIKSKSFIYNLIEKYDIKVPLIAGKEWNIDEKRLVINPEIYDLSSQKWVRKAEKNKAVVPTNFEAYESFIENLIVNQDKVTGIITISYESISPILAKTWVEAIIKEINYSLRQEKIIESQKSISYLKQQLLKTDVTEMRNVFFNLIQEQTKAMLLAEVQIDYAFKVIDSPVIPEKKSGPRRATICIVGTMLGFMVSIIMFLFLHFVTKTIGKR